MRLLKVPFTVLVLVVVLCIEPTLCSRVCSGRKDIFVAEGKNVTLQINETEVKEISWLQNGFHIASVVRGTLIVKTAKLRGRLNSTDQGSLMITHVRMKDQGEYTASVLKEEKDCIQLFGLKVYPKLLPKDIDISTQLSESGSCNLTCVVNKKKTKIFWTNESGNNTIVTDHYTLILDNTDPNSNYTCTAENPLTRISRSIQPWSACWEGETAISQPHQNGSNSSWIPIFIVVLIILLAFVLIKKKTQISGFLRKTKSDSSATSLSVV
ncbi:SLAM family member 5-like [Dendropsophus ebraccatus]|uniref:SLAM family member 5-like n=1 Tax=Dendropsophus ebraccatus TaxID=150705 RepID=UPI0038313ADA